MAKNPLPATPPEAVISIVGAGMSLDGDCETDGSLRIEGTIRGNVRAGKSVVVGRNGVVEGSIYTQDAVISGQVLGSVTAESRLELQETSHITGEISTNRLQVDDGAALQGQVSVGGVQGATQAKTPGVTRQDDALGGGQEMASSPEAYGGVSEHQGLPGTRL